MKIIQQYTPPTVNLGHATSADDKKNTTSYLIFPEVIAPESDTSNEERTWYALFAESAADVEFKSMAAQISVESMYRYMIENQVDKDMLRQSLEAALCHANSTLVRLAKKDQIRSSFRTSALGACIDGDRFYFTYVGNVNAYLLRNNAIYHLTYAFTTRQRDHQPHYPQSSNKNTSVGHRRFAYDLEPYIDSPKDYLGEKSIPTVKHISFNVTNKLPHNAQLYNREVVCGTVMDHLLLRPDDTIVLCSSSISRTLSQRNIEEVATALPPQLAAEEIIKMAERRSPDRYHSSVVLRQNVVTPSVDYIIPNRAANHRNAAAPAVAATLKPIKA